MGSSKEIGWVYKMTNIKILKRIDDPVQEMYKVVIAAIDVYNAELIQHTCHGIQGKDTTCKACILYNAIQIFIVL